VGLRSWGLGVDAADRWHHVVHVGKMVLKVYKSGKCINLWTIAKTAPYYRGSVLL